MMQTIEANWVAFAVALLAVLVVGWLLLARARSKPTRREYKPDVLDQGAASVQRNQALIDAAPAAQVTPPPQGATMGGIGEAVAIGAQDVVEEAATQPVPESPPEIQPAPPPPPAPAPQPEVVPSPEPQPEIVPSVEPIPAPSPPTAAPAGDVLLADDLSRIKGLGPKLQKLLPTLGLSTFAQIAALTDSDLAELDTKLGAFAGRPAKDNWVEQAKYLAAGDTAGFEARFGKV
ncbi:MAG: hypothetical protein ACLGHF_07915 [Alphaproteobacteria bacterium]